MKLAPRTAEAAARSVGLSDTFHVISAAMPKALNSPYGVPGPLTHSVPGGLVVLATSEPL